MSDKINLAQLIFDRIEDDGVEKSAVFFGKTPATIKKWQGGSVMPDIGAAQKILDSLIADGLNIPVFEKAPPQGGTRPDDEEMAPEPVKKTVVSDGNADKKLGPPDLVKIAKKAHKYSMLTPINREMSYPVVLSMLGNWKATLPPEIRSLLSIIDFEPDTLPHRGRNILATRFLASGNEWSFWMDSDIVAPIGNPGWFKRRTGTKHADKWFTHSAIEKLSSHNKTIVSGVYAERNTSGRIIAQPGLSPRNADDTTTIDELKKHGPQDKLIQVGWVGFGCVAVHRKVFEDILVKFPEAKAKKDGDPHDFFTSTQGGPNGEDLAFCQKALQAGHASYMDLSVFAGHIGRWCFTV